MRQQNTKAQEKTKNYKMITTPCLPFFMSKIAEDQDLEKVQAIFQKWKVSFISSLGEVLRGNFSVASLVWSKVQISREKILSVCTIIEQCLPKTIKRWKKT